LSVSLTRWVTIGHRGAEGMLPTTPPLQPTASVGVLEIFENERRNLLGKYVKHAPILIYIVYIACIV
jgi:hypothetical protein